jgi:hypothetical protein
MSYLSVSGKIENSTYIQRKVAGNIVTLKTEMTIFISR